ncbi:MAG: phage major capsid protein [Kiritimatiellia bacterium]
MKLKTLYRALESASISVDVEKRTARFSFSSEYPVERYFGKEILSHAQGAADLSRLVGGANVLWNHDRDQVLGVCTGAEIGADRRGYVDMRFCEGPFAEEKMRNMSNGTLPNVSFAYRVLEVKLQKSGDDGDEYLITKWMPFEVSSVSIPADPTVGLGRADEDAEIEVPVINDKPVTKTREITIMDPVEMQKAKDEAAANAKKAERERTETILAIGEKHGMQVLARELIAADKSIGEAQAAFLERMGKEQKPITGNEAVVGLNQKEIRQYSFLRALNALANPNDSKALEAAAFEREVSAAASKLQLHSQKRQTAGLVVPVDILRAKFDGRRDLTVGSATGGGNLVSTDLESQSFIEILRNQSAVMGAGARMLNGLVGNVAIPKQTGSATAYWVAESGAPTESQQTVGQVTLRPKTLGAYTDISRQLLLQSSIDVESMVRSDLAAIVALAIDLAALYGTGADNQPTGVKLVSGIGTKDFGAATPTFAEIVELETKLTAANAGIGSMKYIVNAAMRGALKSAEKASGHPIYIMDDKGQMNGFDSITSNQVASGDVFFANWADLMIGMWSGLDLTMDPFSLSTSGAVRLVALQDCDVAVRHAASFARGNNTL